MLHPCTGFVDLIFHLLTVLFLAVWHFLKAKLCRSYPHPFIANNALSYRVSIKRPCDRDSGLLSPEMTARVTFATAKVYTKFEFSEIPLLSYNPRRD